MINIRPVRSDELDATKQLIAQIFPDAPFNIGDNDLLIVAEFHGGLIGFAHLIDRGDFFLLQGIGVSESARNLGIGSRLLESIISIATLAERSIYLKVKCHNRAVSLYGRYGFTMKKFDGSVYTLIRPPNS